MAVLRCKGPHYWMGYQQGQALRLPIRNSFEALINFEGYKLAQPSIFTRSSYLRFIQTVSFCSLKLAQGWRARNQNRRLKGMADGAGMDKTPLYLLAMTENFLTQTECTLFCTGVGVEAWRSSEDGPILARNFDFFKDFGEFDLIRESHPTEGYASLELTTVSGVGAHAGINQEGLAILYNYSLTREPPRLLPPITWLVQEALERCKDVEAALRFFKARCYPTGALLMLGDAQGRLLTLEVSPSRIGIRYPQEGILINTNFYLTPQLSRYNLPFDARFGNRTLVALRGTGVYRSSLLRYARAQEFLATRQRIDLEAVIELLRDHGQGPGGDDTICLHGQVFATTASLILIPNLRQILVLLGHPCRGRYRRFRI